MDQQTADKVLAQINDDHVIALLRQMINIPSPAYGEAELAEFCAAYMKRCGMDVELQTVEHQGLTSKNAIGRLSGSGESPSLMFNGHLDSNLAKEPRWGWEKDEKSGWCFYRPDLWTKPPFDSVIEDGWIYGLGAKNMKMGIAGMIAAVEAVKKSGIPLKGDLVVSGVMGETPGGIGVRHMLKSGVRTDMAIVTECTNLDVVSAAVGVVRGKIDLEGRTLHHDPYTNATEIAVKIANIFGPTFHPAKQGAWLTFEPDADLPGYPRVAVRSIEGSGDFCSLNFEVRTTIGQTEESIREDVQRILDQLTSEHSDLRARLTIPPSPLLISMMATKDPQDETVVQIMAKSHLQVTGRNPVVGAGNRLGGAADSFQLRQAGIKTVEYGAGDVKVWPMYDEANRLEDVLTATRVYALAAAELCL